MTIGTTAAAASPSAASAGHAAIERASSVAIGSWALLEWAGQPFYTLITTFLFAPYFANVFIGDPVKGQSLWGYAAAAAGLGVAIGTPILGAIADAGGRRKPWMLAMAVIMAAGMATLWLAAPGATERTWIIVIAFVAAAFAAESIVMFANAIMPTLVPADQIGRLSGLGYAVGYLGGLLSLLIMVGLIVTNPATGKTLLGLDPLLQLDAATRQGDRLVGPFCAVWFLVFMVPFFFFTPERNRMAAPAKPARSRGLRAGLSDFGHTLRQLPRHRNILRFLIARMLYADGLSAIFAFGGIYGASVYGWQAFEQGLFGIILVVVGIVGAYAGGFLDDKFGPTTVIIASLLVIIVGTIGILSIDGTHVLFSIVVPVKAAGGAPFGSTGERVFLLFAVLIGMVAAPVGAASRSLMARIAPPDKMTQFFGLFAFSGKVTAFLAPFAVAAVTQITGSQRAGVGIIAVFLLVGLVLMLSVRAEPETAV